MQGGEEWTYPVRITVLNLPEDAGTIEELIKIVGIPFLADSERAPMITDAKTLLARLQEEEQWREKAEESGKKGTNLQVISGVIPEALRIMLDDFTSRIGSLTQAESQILLYYMDGYDIADIPELASVTINTVRKHNRNIYSKLAIKSKEELMLYLDILQHCDMFDSIEEQLKIQANQRLEAGA
ncbi:MAG: helix-turn-helix transcriptional regulator [Lachnospiraceae bacterium]